MADIRLIREGIPNLLPMTGRTNTVHVSDILRYVSVSLGHLPAQSTLQMTRMQLGNALEHAITERYAQEYEGRYLHGEEVIDEDSQIAGTKDLFDLEDGAIEEIKLTWLSSKHEPDSEKYWRHWQQIKAYCRMHGTDLGRLHVCNVQGDHTYTDSGAPTYRVWEQRFSKRELQDTWTMIQRNRDKAAEFIGMVKVNGIWQRPKRLEGTT